jgi:hypothetical protein
MSKRKSPIAKSLVSNSIAGIFSGIEIHNKPTIKYRYQTVVLLVLNAWELLLKGFIYKFHKDIKLFHKDGTTKTFENCLNLVNQKIGKDFNVVSENLIILYGYRNQVAHFYIEELDPIVFSLISKNIIFFSNFLKQHFNIDISKDSDLILLPIGFKRSTSPIDYISTESVNEKASPEVKEFLKTIVDSTKKLSEQGIAESIFVDFRINLINVNKITNADLIAGIDNTKTNDVTFAVNKESRKIVFTKDSNEKVGVTRNRSEAQGTLYYEELQEGIFDEINNLLDANKLLSKGKPRFMLGAALYYRIYSERQYVNYTIDTFDLLARTGAIDFYGPFLYWLTKLPPKNISNILFDMFHQSKSPNIHNLIKMSIILGRDATDMFFNLMDSRYKKVVQKPDFFYTFQDQLKLKTNNSILKALKATVNKVFIDGKKYDIFLQDGNLSINMISQECLNVFSGDTTKRTLIRELDYLAYGNLLDNNRTILDELKLHA